MNIEIFFSCAALMGIYEVQNLYSCHSCVNKFNVELQFDEVVQTSASTDFLISEVSVAFL